MDYFLLIGMLAISVIMISFLAYKFQTEKIIKEQEKENAALRTENMRLKAALKGKRTDRMAEIVKPSFKKW